MSDFKQMVFRLDPYKREEQGARVEKHLQNLGYTSNEGLNKTERLMGDSVYITTFSDGMYSYYVHDCGVETFEPIPDEVSNFEERPKGVIGQWYTLTSDFDGEGVAKYKEAGYTWQCEEVDGLKEPKIDGIVIDFDESYRLATPEEIERAKANQSKKEVVFSNYSDKIIQTYNRLRDQQLKKNADYGDSVFKGKTVLGVKMDAKASVLARIGDKLARLESNNLQVSDESHKDTIDDLIGYLVAYRILMD